MGTSWIGAGGGGGKELSRRVGSSGHAGDVGGGAFWLYQGVFRGGVPRRRGGSPHASCVCAQWVRFFVTPGTPLTMGFSRQEYWSGLPFPPQGDLPNPGIEPASSALQAYS